MPFVGEMIDAIDLTSRLGAINGIDRVSGNIGATSSSTTTAISSVTTSRAICHLKGHQGGVTTDSGYSNGQAELTDATTVTFRSSSSASSGSHSRTVYADITEYGA